MLMDRKRGIIPALDVPTLDAATFIIRHTTQTDGVVAYKIGKRLGLTYGLPKVIAQLSALTSHPLIYDDQKSPNDIPAQAREFVDTCSAANVRILIGFPHSGPAVMEAFLDQCRKRGIQAIIGLHMTHEKFLRSEGGWISDDAPTRAFTIAVNMGVTDFVVPGTKPEYVKQYYDLLTKDLHVPKEDLQLYAPGFIGQGGVISDCGAVAGDNWCAILGGVYTKIVGDWRKMRRVSAEMATQIA